MKELDKNHTKVSIITASLNSKRYLENAIKSVSEQTYPNIEYIIIDGGSTDGSAEIFNKYRNRINRLLVEKDSGIFDAMNKGIGLASGEIIYFLNSDDRFYDNQVVEKVAEVFTKNKEIDFIYGNIVVFDPANRSSYIERYPGRISKWLFIRKTIAHPASFFRSSCFQNAGCFDPRYKIAADYEWYLRAIFIKGLKAIHIEDNISIFRLGGRSTDEANRKPYLLERDSIQRKYFNALELLYIGVLSRVKRLLGKRGNKFLHNLLYRKERAGLLHGNH